MSVFRASDWVTYEPVADARNNLSNKKMDQDVDMDAPQISTLREEETPPPQRTPTHSSRFRVKLVVQESKSAASPSGSAPRNQRGDAGQWEGGEDDEDEEDQLIDDDDDMKPIPAAALSHPRSSEISPKRRPPSSKRKPRKSDKKVVEEERRPQEQHPDAANLAPTMTWFEATPSETHQGEEVGSSEAGNLGVNAVHSESILPKASPKKKVSSKKGQLVPRPKAKAPLKIKPLLADEAGMVSEAYTGTGPLSPIAAHFDVNSPEPDNMGTYTSAPLAEDINLESTPLPVFPLPSKPFPVQPPTKIGTGFAPMIPLDKSGKKVRHWRVAHREIRGIAGGRWFARSWVGGKDSEFASALAKDGDSKQSGSAGVALPKLSAVSISTPPSGRGKKGSKSSLAGSAMPSRAGSAIPDHTAPIRPPTKMRTILSAAPPSEEGNDSDMVAPKET